MMFGIHLLPLQKKNIYIYLSILLYKYMLIGLKLLSAANQIDFMPLVISNDLNFKQSFE